MFSSATRKLRQLARDPVLRRYLTGRLLGRWPALPAPALAALPYGGPAPACAQPGPGMWAEMTVAESGAVLPLPGVRAAASPDMFHQHYEDGETLSALHRFAWLPLLGENARAGDVDIMWRAWVRGFATPDDGPAWEAYSAAERAINLLDWGRRCGLPGPVGETVGLLAAHAPAIAARLEYFGEHATHNHLLNNGRGLYRLGCDLAMPAWAAYGAEIIRTEARRLFLPSGMLREGSSHYQLLYVRNLADCWLAARRAGRPEAEEWRGLLVRSWAALAGLTLRGGLPLIGDISPDSPPAFLSGLLPGGDVTGWVALLPADERDVLLAERDRIVQVPMAADGWLAAKCGPWEGLWYASPEGWCFSPGHGHQDVGAPELHYQGEAIFVDPGRGAYGEDGEAALYRSGAVHGGLQVDGADPYPVNKPYYAESFRRAVGGPPPRQQRQQDGVNLAFDGFARLGGVGSVERHWQFSGSAMIIEDRVAGRGRHTVTRRLVTPHPARMEGGAVVVETPDRRFRITACAPLSVRAGKRWAAYGEAAPARVIEAQASVPLDWSGRMTIEVG